MQDETICAIATPPGVGGVGIVRISGSAAAGIAEHICGRAFERREMTFAHFRDTAGQTIDSGMALFFKAPHSFTGEDVLELQGHGGPVVQQMLMQQVIGLGARPARPGEFSERAFLNGKLDLVQAEAIADLVSSGTTTAARAAQRSLSGVFSAEVQALQRQLEHIRVFVEASIDFPEEEIDFLADSDVLQQLEKAQQQVAKVIQEARQGRLLRDGIVLAILGRPNAGKSSLMNALSGQDSAIVTEIPGTTRDVLREWIDLDGIPVHVADTAGIRETEDRIEAEGVRRARLAVEGADLVLVVLDCSEPLQPQIELLDELADPQRAVVVLNKIDLGASDAGALISGSNPALEPVPVSALTGQGLDAFKAKIRERIGLSEQADGGFSARQRHVDALRRTGQHLESGRQRLVHEGAAELLAEELRLAQQALGEITGERLPDDLLGAIFSSFCIGK